MSYLKNILIELHNCLDEYEPENEIPMVWSKEFQQRLAQNAYHWNEDQRRASHVSVMDFQTPQDVDIPYHDNTDSLSQAEITYNPEFDDQVWSPEFTEYEEKIDDIPTKGTKSKWGVAYRQWLNAETEEEEQDARMHLNLTGLRGDEHDDCPACFGTGTQFPRLKGECPECEGSRKVKKEEQEVSDEKQQRAERVRDRAREVRDRARDARDRAREKRQQEKGLNKDPDFNPDEQSDQEDLGQQDQSMNGGEQEWDDPDYQGSIRTVKNAHLVYKRQQKDGTFDELWQFNVGDNFKKELETRRAILAGTDIPINKMRSPDNNQSYELWTVGNGQLLKIIGLPN